MSLLENISDVSYSKTLEGSKHPVCLGKGSYHINYKSDDPSNPKNFRPITPENVLLKGYTSFIRNRIFEYLKANDYIECRVQKGFIPKISGTTEHTQQLAYKIRHAKRKQKTLVVTLLDLKNAFGEVSHSLIPTVLQFHHIPRGHYNFRQCVSHIFYKKAIRYHQKATFL